MPPTMSRASPHIAPAVSVPLRRAAAAVGCIVVAVCSFPHDIAGQTSFAIASSARQRAVASTAAHLPSQQGRAQASKFARGERNSCGYALSAFALVGGMARCIRCRQQRFSMGATASNNDAGEGAEVPARRVDADGYVEKGNVPAGDLDKAGDGNMISQLTAKWNSLSFNTQEDIKTFVTSLTIALSFRAIFVEPRFIPSLSMYPTFDIGDQLTVDKISRNWRDFQRRDVVVFNPPPSFNEVTGIDRSGEALIKRIVALEGDVVEVKNGGVLYINGERQEETFTNENAAYNFGPVTVPKNCVFVLGDNRNQSLDGHVWGFLPKENIIGRATLKFWPPWRVGSVQAAPP